MKTTGTRGWPRLKKTYLITIMISLSAHAAVLSTPILFRHQASGLADEGIITVELKRSMMAAVEPPPEKEEPVKQVRSEASRHGAERSSREETITMGSKESKYRDYLRKVKARIESRWIYPGRAFERGEKGITTVKFSIAQDGSLVANVVTSSSGYDLLDECAMNVVRAAAPYDPLPRESDLSRLHIIASFHYHLDS
jgi:TonB family protein